MLRTIQFYIGSLDRVDYFVKALGLVNSAGDFCNMPAVMNGFSDLMVEIFGQRGRHARAAMGSLCAGNKTCPYAWTPLSASRNVRGERHDP